MSVQLTLLGTGTPTPLVHRAGSSYLLQVGNESILVDCGPFCVRRLLEKGISPTEISSLFLTHLHYDHCVDYGHLVLTLWDQGAGKIPELQVYGPPPTQRMTQLLFDESGVYGPDLAARTEHPGSEFIYEMRGGILPRQRPQPVATEVEDGLVVESNNLLVKVAEVVHCQPQLTCLAYRFEMHGVSIVFGGDTAPTPSLTTLAKDANVLLHMCHFVNGVVVDPRLTNCCSGHLDAAKTAREANVGTLILVHITEQVEQPGIRERVLHEAGTVFDGRIIFAQDLLEIPVSDTGPQTIQ